jgi:hypothetical protein
MASSGVLRRVALVRTDVSEELSASIIRATRIGEQGTTLPVTSNLLFLCSMRRLLVTDSAVPSSPILVTLMKESLSTSETSVLTRTTRRIIPEDAFLNIALIHYNDKWRALVKTLMNFRVLKNVGEVLEWQHN